MGNAALARPAQFDHSRQRRNSMLGKIHVAKKQLRMVDDDFTQLLLDTTRQIRLSQCSEAQLSAFIEALKSKGFRPLPKAGDKGAAQHPMARKARALWISLNHLGVVHSPKEQALETFARKQLKCERLIWAKQSHSAPLIEALKSWAERNGWAQADHRGRAFGPIGLKESLCKAIVQRLKDEDEIPQDWSLDIAALRLCGIVTAGETPFSAERYDELAKALGEHLRPALARKGGCHEAP